MENRYKTFTNLIVHISRSIQKIKNEEMSLLGFKGTQVQCLFSLYSLEEGASTTELSQICNEDKGMMSRTIKELMEKNLIYMDEKKEQKYRNPWKLTEEGKKVSKIITQKISNMLESASEGISENERGILYASLLKISNNLTTICDKYGGNQ